MFQNMLMTTVTPLCNTNEIDQWENRPFMHVWPEMRQQKPNKESHVTKTIKKRKRNRTSYTTEQLRILEKIYTRTKYINAEHRKELAGSLKINEKCIKVWFQNRRMKEKRESSESSDSSSDCNAETVTPPPKDDIIACNEDQYMVPYHYEPVPNNQNHPNDTCSYVDNNEISSLNAYYHNYDAQNINYNIPTYTSEYFRNDNNVYPTHYYPYTPSGYTYSNVDENQPLHQNEEQNWSPSSFDLDFL